QGAGRTLRRGDPHRPRDGARPLDRARARPSPRLSPSLVQILDGRAVAAKVLAEVKAGVEELVARSGVAPMLAVVMGGDFAPSKIYVRNKKKAADEAGIASRDYLFPEGCSQTELVRTLGEINRDPGIHGVLLQLPLPAGLDEDAAVNAIAPE